MKKINLLFLVFIFLFSFSACQSNKPEPTRALAMNEITPEIEKNKEILLNALPITEHAALSTATKLYICYVDEIVSVELLKKGEKDGDIPSRESSIHVEIIDENEKKYRINMGTIYGASWIYRIDESGEEHPVYWPKLS